jgi:hypothetical protein
MTELTLAQIENLPRAYEAYAGGAVYHGVLLSEKPDADRSPLLYRTLCGRLVGGSRVYRARFSSNPHYNRCKRCCTLLGAKIDRDEASGL